MQDSSSVSSSKYLNNEFNMVIALPEEKIANISADKTTKSLVAIGEILDVDTYDENTIYSQCIQKDCVMNMHVEFSWDSAQSKISMIIKGIARNGTQEVDDRGVVVKEIRILGDFARSLDISLWNKLVIQEVNKKTQQSTDQFEISRDSLVVKINSGILLKAGSNFRIENQD